MNNVQYRVKNPEIANLLQGLAVKAGYIPHEYPKSFANGYPNFYLARSHEAWFSDVQVGLYGLASSDCEIAKTFRVIGLEEIIDILQEPAPKKGEAITVKLNGTYVAKVTRSGIRVGCQTFSHAAVSKLFDASRKKIEEIELNK